MKFEHPATVIDQTVANLEYLAEFFLDDIDHGAVDRDQLTARAVRAIAALEVSRVLLPRLRIVRSNYVTDSRLPDARAGAELLASTSTEENHNTCEATASSGHTGVLR